MTAEAAIQCVGRLADIGLDAGDMGAEFGINQAASLSEIGVNFRNMGCETGVQSVGRSLDGGFNRGCTLRQDRTKAGCLG